MYISIKYLKKEIKNRGGKITKNSKNVIRSYSIHQDFENTKRMCKKIIKNIDPQYDSKDWYDDYNEIQKRYKFKIFGKKNQIYFKHGNTVSIVKVKDKEGYLLGKYVEKIIVDSSHSYHEILIGLVLNKLNTELRDNFVFTFNFEDITINRRRIGKKNKKVDVLNIYMEYIDNSVTFGTYIEEKSTKSFLMAYFNVALVLRDAYKETGFTHFDMHTGNILLERVDDDTQFSYSNGISLLTSRKVKIIDYGFSSIKYKDHTYKIEGNERLFLGEEDNPITDCFKLLIHSYKRLEADRIDEGKEFNKNIFEKIFRFFCVDNTIDEMVQFNNLNNHYNNIPKYYPESGLEKMDSFINYLDKLIDEEFP